MSRIGVLIMAGLLFVMMSCPKNTDIVHDSVSGQLVDTITKKGISGYHFIITNGNPDKDSSNIFADLTTDSAGFFKASFNHPYGTGSFYYTGVLPDKYDSTNPQFLYRQMDVENYHKMYKRFALRSAGLLHILIQATKSDSIMVKVLNPDDTTQVIPDNGHNNAIVIKNNNSVYYSVLPQKKYPVRWAFYSKGLIKSRGSKLTYLPNNYYGKNTGFQIIIYE